MKGFKACIAREIKSFDKEDKVYIITRSFWNGLPKGRKNQKRVFLNKKDFHINYCKFCKKKILLTYKTSDGGCIFKKRQMKKFAKLSSDLILNKKEC